jgi:hypothetical protein
MYDSKNDTLKHIKKVRSYLLYIERRLYSIGLKHDNSKLEEPEKRIFDEFTPKLKNITYGSNEYKSYLNQMQEGLKHHYEWNTHHPEYFKNGIRDMNLIDIIEMFCDWTAATKRHNDGDIYKSIKLNKNRFKYDDLLESIFKNTADYFNNSYEVIEKILDKEDNDNIRTIVYDWFNGLSVYNEAYKAMYTETEHKIASSVILTLVSAGLG